MLAMPVSVSVSVSVSGPNWGRSWLETMVDNWTTKIRQPFLVGHAHQSNDRTEGKAAEPRSGTLKGLPTLPPSLSLTHSLCLSHTNEELMMLTINVKINSIRGYRLQGKKLPVMTHCSAVEAEDGGQNGVWARVLRGSLVGHRLCLGLCVYFVLSWVWGTSEGCRPDNGYTCALPLPLLQPQTCPFVRLND